MINFDSKVLWGRAEGCTKLGTLADLSRVSTKHILRKFRRCRRRHAAPSRTFRFCAPNRLGMITRLSFVFSLAAPPSLHDAFKVNGKRFLSSNGILYSLPSSLRNNFLLQPTNVLRESTRLWEDGSLLCWVGRINPLKKSQMTKTHVLKISNNIKFEKK